MNLTKLKERAKELGIGLLYRYDGHADHPAFCDSDCQFALVKNWGVMARYRTQLEVSAALDALADNGNESLR